MENLISGILAYSTANTSELDNVELDLHEVVSGIEDSIFIPDNVTLVAPRRLPHIIAGQNKGASAFPKYNFQCGCSY